MSLLYQDGVFTPTLVECSSIEGCDPVQFVSSVFVPDAKVMVLIGTAKAYITRRELAALCVIFPIDEKPTNPPNIRG